MVTSHIIIEQANMKTSCDIANKVFTVATQYLTVSTDACGHCERLGWHNCVLLIIPVNHSRTVEQLYQTSPGQDPLLFDLDHPPVTMTSSVMSYKIIGVPQLCVAVPSLTDVVD